MQRDGEGLCEQYGHPLPGHWIHPGALNAGKGLLKTDKDAGHGGYQGLPAQRYDLFDMHADTEPDIFRHIIRLPLTACALAGSQSAAQASHKALSTSQFWLAATETTLPGRSESGWR